MQQLAVIARTGERSIRKFDEQNKPEIKNFLKLQSICGNLPSTVMEANDVLNVLVSSSAGLEFLFSTMGFICDSKRNRLDPEKHKKLAFCYKMLQGNKKFKFIFF